MSAAASCPCCASPSVQIVSVPTRSVGAAVLAELTLGTAAAVAASSSTVLQAACAKCGAQWFPGTKAEARMRALSGQLGEDARSAEEERVAAEKVSAEQAVRKRDQRNAGIIGFGIIAAVLLSLLTMCFDASTI